MPPPTPDHLGAPGIIARLRSIFYRYDTLSPGLKHPKAYFNWLRANWEMRRRSDRIKARPLKLTFDPTNICQLRCPLCPTGMRMPNRGSLRADLETFKGLMEEVGDYVFFMDLFNWGEPMLNKSLPQFIRIAKDHRVSTTISTNLSLQLTDERLRELIQSGLNEMIVSLDGASRETAGIYRRSGDFDLVVENMRRVAKLKRELRSRTPYLVWRFLVFRFNEHELSEAARIARDIGVDRLTVAPAFLDEGDYEIPDEDRKLMKTWVPTDPRMTYYDPVEASAAEPGQLRKTGTAGKRRTRCDWHYTSTAINADGSVAPCCALFHNKDDFGSIAGSAKQSYMQVVNNDKFVSIRNHFSGRSPEPTGLVCDECPAPNIMDYAKSLNRWIAIITIACGIRLVLLPVRWLFRHRRAAVPRPTLVKSPVPIEEVAIAEPPRSSAN